MPQLELERREDKHRIITLTADVSPFNVVVCRTTRSKATGTTTTFSQVTISADQFNTIAEALAKAAA